MWTHALQINWMESLATIFLCMMVIAGAVELWQRQSGTKRGKSSENGQSKTRGRRRKIAVA
jgi:hypothetical protein